MVVRKARCLGLSLTVLACAGEKRPATDSTRAPSPIVASDSTPPTPPAPAPRGPMLTLADVPSSALRALHDSIPEFAPWDTAMYPSKRLAGVRVSADAGVVVLRGNFRGVGDRDYIIAGHIGEVPLIIALLARDDSTYVVAGISEGGRRADSTTGEPPVVLEKTASDDPSPGSPPLYVVVSWGGESTMAPNNKYVWVPARRKFLLVGPD